MILYLKTADGDYDSITAMNAGLATLTGGAGLTENVEVRVQNGQSFGDYSEKIGFDITGKKLNGFSITITSDIVTPATLGILKVHSVDGAGALPGTPEVDTGVFQVTKLIIKMSGLGGNASLYGVSSFIGTGREYNIVNCLIFTAFTGDSAGFYLTTDQSAVGFIRVINNSIYHSFIHSETPGDYAIPIIFQANAGGAADSIVANNLVCAYNISAVTVDTGKNFNNNIYSYNGTNTWGVTGTAVNLTKLDPATTQAVIVTYSETVDTMAGKTATPTASSTALIDLGDPTYAPTTDIIGNPRT